MTSTRWTANLTEEAAKLAYGTSFWVTRIAAELARLKPRPQMDGRWSFQTTLDAGNWAPEQVTLFEELALVAPPDRRMRRLFGR